jgi:hypothetical protein
MLFIRVAQIIILFISLLSCATAPQESVNMTFRYEGGQVSLLHNHQDCFILIDGDINQALKRAYSDAKNSANKQGCAEKMVMIKSHGGDLEVAMDLGRQIRWEKFSTDMHGYCESACVFIYIGGVKRYVHLNSQVVENSHLGVHQPSSELLFHKCIPKNPESGPIIQEISQYLHLMLSREAAAQLSQWVFTTSCQKITYIDSAAMLNAGIATTQVDFH